MYVTRPPAATVDGETESVTARSAEGVTRRLLLAVLFAGLGSVSLALAVALSVSVPDALPATLATTVTVADAPLASDPSVHARPLVVVQVPWE